jgi:dephospho-CoA kinase
MDAIAQLSVPYMDEIVDEKDRVVITGMRGWTEKKRFEDEIGENIDIIGVWASRETRRERREDRQREEDRKGDGFHERDLREIENGVGKMLALSDHLIENNNITMEELKQEVNKIVSS